MTPIFHKIRGRKKIWSLRQYKIVVAGMVRQGIMFPHHAERSIKRARLGMNYKVDHTKLD
jgi:hypothetical protein